MSRTHTGTLDNFQSRESNPLDYGARDNQSQICNQYGAKPSMGAPVKLLAGLLANQGKKLGSFQPQDICWFSLILMLQYIVFQHLVRIKTFGVDRSSLWFTAYAYLTSRVEVSKKKAKFGQLIIKADSLMSIIFGNRAYYIKVSFWTFLSSWKHVLSTTQLQFLMPIGLDACTLFENPSKCRI